MKLTVRFLYWSLLALSLYVAFAYFRLPLLRLFLLICLMLPLFSLMQLLWNYFMADVRVSCLRPLIPRGSDARWQISIKNRSRLTMLPVRVRAFAHETQKKQKKLSRILYATLEKSQEKSAILSIPTYHCGMFDGCSLQIAVGDLFGFFYLNVPRARLGGPISVTTVLPLADAHPELTEEVLIFTQAGEVKSKQPLNESEEFHQLRPLRSGDPLKRIHWKLSARSNQWMVKQNQPADEIFWTMIIDVQTMSQSHAINDLTDEHCMNVRDYALDAAAALIENALYNRRRIVLKTYEDQVRILQSAELTAHPQFLGQLATTPARDSLSLSEQLLREQENNISGPYVFVTTSMDDDCVRQMQLFMQRQAELFLLYFPLDRQISEDLRRALDELRLAGMRVAVFIYPDETDKEKALSET